MQRKRLTTTHPPPHTRALPKTRSQHNAMVEGDKRRERRDKHEKYGIVLDIAVTQPQGEDDWVGIGPPSIRQILKSRFENSSNYANALTNLLEKRLVFFRGGLGTMNRTCCSKTLIEQSDTVSDRPYFQMNNMAWKCT